MEGVLCLSHILLLASSAFDEVDDIARLAGSCSSYVEVLASGGACERLPSSDVLACEATSVVAWFAPLVWLVVYWLELCTNQKVP